MPRSASRSASKTPSSTEKRVTRGSVRSPAAAAKSSPAQKSPAKSKSKSPAVASSPKKSTVPVAKSRSRVAATKSPQQERGRSASAKRKSAPTKSTKAKESPEIKTVSRGRSSQRRTKQTKSYAEEEDDDEDEMSVDEEEKTPVKRAARKSSPKSKKKAVVAKSPARGRSRAKSSSPRQKRAPAPGRRSRSLVKDKEEQVEQEAKDETEDKDEEEEEVKDETEDKEETEVKDATEEKEEEEHEAKDESEDKEEEEEVTAEAAADEEEEEEEEAGDEAEVENESDKAMSVDEVATGDKPDTAPPGVTHAQSAAAHVADSVSPAEELDSVNPVEELPHVDRKRKFDEIEDKSDEDVEEVAVVSPVKVLKVCEESDVKTTSVEEASADDERTSAAEASAESDAMADSKLSLPISSETNIEDDYVVITPDDVPPVDSDEVLNTVAKMLQPDLASAVSGHVSDATLDSVAVQNPLLQREYIANPAVFAETIDTSRRFTLGSYNILADFHAQRDYSMTSWLTPEQLSLNSRHQRLMEELIYLDEDVICLQEVGGDYMHDVLQPTLESLGYKGVFVARNTKEFCEGEATFYRASQFTLESSESLLLNDIISHAVDASSELEESTQALLKDSLSTYAVAMLTKLRCVASGDVVTVANVHVVWDKFERQDRQCLQLAATMQRLIELAGGLDKPHIICGDFNSKPSSAPYQLMADGHLNDSSFTDLQAILTVDSGDSQLLPVVNFWSDGFQYPVGSAMKSAYRTVQGREPITSVYAGGLHSVDYIWFSSVSLDVLGVLKVVDPQLNEDGLPTAVFHSDHVSIKASFAFK